MEKERANGDVISAALTKIEFELASDEALSDADVDSVFQVGAILRTPQGFASCFTLVRHLLAEFPDLRAVTGLKVRS